MRHTQDQADNKGALGAERMKHARERTAELMEEGTKARAKVRHDPKPLKNATDILASMGLMVDHAPAAGDGQATPAAHDNTDKHTVAGTDGDEQSSSSEAEEDDSMIKFFGSVAVGSKQGKPAPKAKAAGPPKQSRGTAPTAADTTARPSRRELNEGTANDSIGLGTAVSRTNAIGTDGAGAAAGNRHAFSGETAGKTVAQSDSGAAAV